MKGLNSPRKGVEDILGRPNPIKKVRRGHRNSYSNV